MSTPGRTARFVGREVRPLAYPDGPVRPSDFDVVEVPVREPRPGEVLVRNTWTSVDAALRLRLREKAPPGYFPAFPLGRPMDGIMTVGEVVASRADGFAPGDAVRHAPFPAATRQHRRNGRRAAASPRRLRRVLHP
jgi:NADPH-dependent curcumin reductase CurA